MTLYTVSPPKDLDPESSRTYSLSPTPYAYYDKAMHDRNVAQEAVRDKAGGRKHPRVESSTTFFATRDGGLLRCDPPPSQY